MRRGVLLVAAVVAALAAACELATKRSGLQCETTADCRARGEAFAQTICTSTGTCELVTVPDAGTPGSGPCASSESCAISLGGAPGRCVGTQCVSLAPQGLPCTTYGPVTDDSAVVIAALVPQSGLAGDLSQAMAYAAPNTVTEPLLEGILSEWNAAVQTDGGTPIAPRFAAVVCDESQRDAQKNLAALALFQQLKPQIIVGPVSGEALGEVTTAFPNTPIFSPMGDSQDFAQNPPSENTHFFCSPNRASTIQTFQSAIDLVARYATTQPGHGSSVKVAIVENSTEPNEYAFLGSIKTNLTFNGQTGVLGGNFQTYDVQTDVTQQQAASFVGQAEQIAEYGPDVVVLTGASWAQQLVYQVENRWPLAPSGAPRPLYLVYQSTDALAAYAGGAKPPVLNRIFALDVNRQGNPLGSNYLTLRGTESQFQTGFDNFVGAPFNDCLYAAMYATTAASHGAGGPAGATSLSAKQIASGMAQVAGQSSSNPVNLTVDGVKPGIGLLSTGTSTQLVGTTVFLGMDPQSGTPALTSPQPGFAIDCIGAGGAGADGGTATAAWEFAGVTYGPNSMPTGAGDAGAAVSCP